MPDKEGSDDEKKSTKSVVNKKQKQLLNQEDYLPEEGYDVARDEGKVKSSKDKKDATTLPVSDEVKKTQKKSKGKSAFEIVKAKYGKAVMDTKKEELDLTKVAEAFGGYIIEAKKRRGRTSLYGNIPPEERGDGSNEKANQAKADKTMSDASKSGKIDDFTSKTITGAPDTKKLQRDAGTGETIVNPVTTSKKTADTTLKVSTAGTGGKVVKNQNKFSTETDLEDAVKGKTKISVTTPKPSIKPKKKTVTKPVSKKPTVTQSQIAFVEPPKPSLKKPKLTKKRQLFPKAGSKNTPELKKVQAKIDAKNPTYRSSVTGKKLPVPRPEPLPKDVLKRVRKVTGRSIAKTQKQVKQIPTAVATGTKVAAKAARKNPFTAAVAVSTVVDVLRGAPKIPKPPTPKGGKVGRRTAG
tara:strand:+ start:622 stop:1851 length:1230 start_codon:yes stop_codon:yes gene_type:complete